MSEAFVTEPMMKGFQHELEKEALVRPLLSRLAALPGKAMGAGAGTGLGTGAIAGGGLGTAVGGVRGYQQAREQGAGTGRALAGGFGGALTGGLIGTAAGAGAGAGLGALAGKLRPEQVLEASKAMAQKAGPMGAGTRFGQRQMHTFTGWDPGKVVGKGGKEVPYIESIRGGAYGARERATAADKALKEIQKGNFPEESRAGALISKLRGRSPDEISAAQRGAALKESISAGKGLQAAERAQELGLTSLPGYARAVAGKSGVKPTEAVRAGLAEQWHTSPGWMKGLMVGFPAASVGGAVLSKDQPGGPGMAERVGQGLGTAGYTLAPLTLGGSIVAGEALSRGLGAAGRGIDVLRGHKRKKPVTPKEPTRPPASEPGDTGQSVASERYAGPAMSGEVPEVVS